VHFAMPRTQRTNPQTRQQTRGIRNPASRRVNACMQVARLKRQVLQELKAPCSANSGCNSEPKPGVETRCVAGIERMVMIHSLDSNAAAATQ